MPRPNDTDPEAVKHSGPDQEKDTILCPVCGAECVQRRCKVVCESDQCRGRVVLNCSEF